MVVGHWTPVVRIREVLCSGDDRRMTENE